VIKSASGGAVKCKEITIKNLNSKKYVNVGGGRNDYVPDSFYKQPIN
jgi:hypothetical protein